MRIILGESMKPTWKIGVVGASGAVGQEIIGLLEKRQILVSSLKCFGSHRSIGTSIFFKGEQVPLEELHPLCFKGLDVVFFSAGSRISKEYADIARKQDALVIDNSSAFRQDPQVPLVIPEVNPEALNRHDLLISNPNCAVVLLLTVLFPLHQKAKIKRLVLSTYQAASGAGRTAMEDLKEETLAFLQGGSYQRKSIPHPYAFNLFLHNSPLGADQYLEEEEKIAFETRKILQDPTVRISATCVRVPVLRAHAESVNAEFHTPLSAEEARNLLATAPGVEIVEDPQRNRFAMPIDAAGKNNVLCSRIREDRSQPKTLDLWIVGDQLLKGAALNAVQILELLEQKGQVPRSTRSNSLAEPLQKAEVPL